LDRWNRRYDQRRKLRPITFDGSILAAILHHVRCDRGSGVLAARSTAVCSQRTRTPWPAKRTSTAALPLPRRTTAFPSPGPFAALRGPFRLNLIRWQSRSGRIRSPLQGLASSRLGQRSDLVSAANSKTCTFRNRTCACCSRRSSANGRSRAQLSKSSTTR